MQSGGIKGNKWERLNQGVLILAIFWVASANINNNLTPITPEIYPPVTLPPTTPDNSNQNIAPLPTPNTPPLVTPPTTPTNPEGVAPSRPNDLPQPTPNQRNPRVDKVMQVALSWVGREFNPGVTAQCAFFVRRVFNEAGYPLPISRQSIDPRNSQSPGMAHSLCGIDVGYRVTTLEQMKPGCVAAFKNTYGNFGPNAITHVGVFGGGWVSPDGTKSIPKDHMIDRNTKGGPVRQKDVKDYGEKFIGGFCPHVLFNK